MSNPYAKYLEGRNPIDVLEQTPRKLAELAEKIGEAGLEKPWAPGKWPGRVILVHLADCEVAFGFRWRQVASTPGLTIQPFDQDAWARWYGHLQAKFALGAFTNARLWNLEFLRSLPAADFQNKATHPERGELTLEKLLEITAGHDVNHIRQLEAMAG